MPDSILAMRYDWDGRSTIVIHNFADKPCAVKLRVDGPNGGRLVNLLSQGQSEADESGRHLVNIEAYGYRWLRVGDLERPLEEEPVPPR